MLSFPYGFDVSFSFHRHFTRIRFVFVCSNFTLFLGSVTCVNYLERILRHVWLVWLRANRITFFHFLHSLYAFFLFSFFFLDFVLVLNVSYLVNAYIFFAFAFNFIRFFSFFIARRHHPRKPLSLTRKTRLQSKCKRKCVGKLYENTNKKKLDRHFSRWIFHLVFCCFRCVYCTK